MNTPKSIFIHHSADSRSTVSNIDAFHRGKDWGGGARARKSSLGYYAQYHWIIDRNGKATQVAADGDERWHCGNAYENRNSVAICLIGNFMPGGDKGPTDAQIAAVRSLLADYRSKYQIPVERVRGHREVRATACPGSFVTKAMIQDWATGDTVADPAFGKRFANQLVIVPEDHGSLWLITKRGERIKIGVVPADVENMLNAVRRKTVETQGMSLADIKRIPLVQ